MNTFHAIVCTAALLAGNGAHAVRALDAPPPARPAALNATRADTPPADDSTSLRKGVVQDVAQDRDRVLINGAWLRITKGTTTVFQQGRPAPATVLSKGQVLSFTLARGVADRSTLGVVYVP